MIYCVYHQCLFDTCQEESSGYGINRRYKNSCLYWEDFTLYFETLKNNTNKKHKKTKTNAYFSYSGYGFTNLRLLLLHWQLRSGRAVAEWREHFVTARVELSVSGVLAVAVARGWVAAPRVTWSAEADRVLQVHQLVGGKAKEWVNLNKCIDVGRLLCICLTIN